MINERYMESRFPPFSFALALGKTQQSPPPLPPRPGTMDRAARRTLNYAPVCSPKFIKMFPFFIAASAMTGAPSRTRFSNNNAHLVYQTPRRAETRKERARNEKRPVNFS